MEGNRKVGDAEAGIKVRYTEAPIPWDQENDSPTHGNGGLPDQIARNLRQGKLEQENTTSHESNLHYVAVLKVQGGLQPVSNVHLRGRVADDSPINGGVSKVIGCLLHQGDLMLCQCYAIG